MQKKVILADKKYSGKFHITIYKDKLISYYGISNSRFFEESNTEPKEFNINKKFEIYKLDKFDQKDHKVKASHILRNEQLEFILGDRIRIYINLNQLEIFKIRWAKKEYIVQSLDFKKSILTGFAGAVIGALVTMVFQNNQSTKSEPTIPPIQEIKNHLDQTNDQMNDKKFKNDSIKTDFKINIPK